MRLLEPDYKAIGERIKVNRTRQGLSQEKLAEMCGLSKTHMSHIETGNTKGSLPTFIQIANVLQISLDDLVCDSLAYEVDAYQREIAKLVEDCSPLEIRVIADIVSATKSILRNRHLTGGDN